MNTGLSIVTGANGHLGNNLVRLLVKNNQRVRAVIRNPKTKNTLADISCAIAIADNRDLQALKQAFAGADKLYAVASTFKMWAKNPEQEVYQNNLKLTENVFAAAAACGIKKIVYISSIAALDHRITPIMEKNGYNKDRRNWYFNSKNDSDKLALKLGKKYGITTVLLLPSAMIGGHCHRLNYSSELIKKILDNKIPIDTGITINWVLVTDVAKACLQAMEKAKDQNRYIIATPKGMDLQQIIGIAQKRYPELRLKTPKKLSKSVLLFIAFIMELISKITAKEPLLQRQYIHMFYQLPQDFCIDKAKQELGFSPTTAKQAIIEAMDTLLEKN